MPEQIYGHSLAGMIKNLLLPFVALLALIFMVLSDRIKNKKRRTIFGLIAFAVFLVFLPNATYLSLELRHLQLGDRVLEDFNTRGILLFTGVTLVGWFEQVFLILAVVSWWKPLRKFQVVGMGVLSILTTWGSVIGIERINSYDLLYKPFKVVQVAIEVLFSNWIIHIGVYSSVLFLVLLFLWSIPYAGNKMVRST